MYSLDDLKQLIKDRPVSSIIGSYINVVRRGSTTKAICPFHDDKDPSLNINDKMGLYKCFACGAGGDAITFVKEYKRLGFVESLEDICKNIGVDFELYSAKKQRSPQDEMGRKILSKATLIYKKIGADGQHQEFNNFKINRKLTDEACETFSLGYAPGNNIISHYLASIPKKEEREFAQNIALKIGLIRKDKRIENRFYDTFRDRIMFPICDASGKTNGFTSRSTKESQKPKYLNSTESFIFNKSNILFGLNHAKFDIRQKDQVIIVEGNMDQIILNQHGIKNVVAIQGTAMSEQSIKTLISMTKNLVLALDSDDPGIKAAGRIQQMLHKEGNLPYHLDFRPQKDPDEYIQAHGVLKFTELLDSPPRFIDWKLDQMLPDPLPEDTDSKLQLLSNIFEILSPLNNQITATERVIALAKRIGIRSDEKQILDNYATFIKNGKSPQRTIKNESPREHAASNKKIEQERVNRETLSYPEQQLLSFLVQNPLILTHDKSDQLLDLLPSGDVKRFVKDLKMLIFEIDDSEYVSMTQAMANKDCYPSTLAGTVGNALYGYCPIDTDEKKGDKILFDFKKRFKVDCLKEEIKQLKKQQFEIQDDIEWNKIATQRKELEIKLGEIKKEFFNKRA